MSEELKPCPFCGSHPKMIIDPSGLLVDCNNENCLMFKQGSYGVCPDVWNKRHIQDGYVSIPVEPSGAPYETLGESLDWFSPYYIEEAYKAMVAIAQESE